ncbi:glycosyltransferase involved in cell wall biosynthesis [Rhodanobacter sp. TND4EL1]
MPTETLPTLLVLASTYPRWKDDHEPGFVHELAKRLTNRFHVIAVVPSAPGAAVRETLDGVEVIRYRYAPRRFETLVNDGGIVTNLQRHHWKLLLVPTFVWAQAWRTWHLLRTRQIDVIHAHWLLPQGLIAAVLGQLSGRAPPFLVTSHGADLFALRGKGLNALKRFVARKAAAVTVVSDAMRDELARMGADVGSVEVQPMGVDLAERFVPDPATKRSHDEILFVGRLVEKKGLRHLIDAMPSILRARPSAHLTVVGFGPEEAERRTQVENLGLHGKIHFAGALSQGDLPARYQRAAVFVAPFAEASSGDQEGLGLVCLEAAGCGCPVVVSDLPATRKVLPEGAGCIRVAPSDSAALADAVVDVLTRREIHLCGVEAFRESIAESFDWRVVGQNYASILEACIDRG